MTQITLRTTEKARVLVPEAAMTARLFFVDHLRSALIVLVVLHHVALVYGASAPFYYIEPPLADPRAFQVLLIFALVNQAWFMGAFFLLAGYFTPGSFDRKGSGLFLKDRLIRLGIPLVVYIFVLSPIAELGVYLMPASLTGITASLTWQSFWQAYPELLGLGPMWFIALLLIFTLGYAGWRILTRNVPSLAPGESGAPGYLGIGIFTLALALASYLVRHVVPLGEPVDLFVDILSFPTVAYLPQYLSFFILGVVASRHDWFRTMPDSLGVVGFTGALLATIVLFPLAFSGRMFSLEVTEELTKAMGHGHWQAAVYALWDSIFAVGMCLAAITLFRRLANRQSQFGTFLSQQGYAVYIIHIPIIVYLAYALRNIEPGSLAKFGLASVVIVPTCFAVAFVIRKIPGASRVI